MSVFDTLGIPSPDECAGVAGLTIGLAGISIGFAALFFLGGGFAAWTLIVAGLFVGWVSFLYCVVWGESH